MDDAPVIKLENVTFAYNGDPVVIDVNLAIAPCDFVSIVGPNGGGKTTLLKLMLGLITPAAGSISVLSTAPAAARSLVGYVPQRPEIDPQFPATVMDAVLMGRLGRRTMLGPFRRADRAAARQALQHVDATELAHHALSDLSGGQRQRVWIARALASDPKLLLLDEPTAGLDVTAEKELYSYLNQLSHHLTVVMVSHDLGFVSQFVRTVVCVNRRVIVHPTSEVTGEMIADIYGTNVHMVRHDHHWHDPTRDHSPDKT